ncbi:quinone oxidoreductase family protein [Rhabdothermincola salaria]|uniref:quinone oxidoreductase family protein n=1 Tax=Rhabdothermincola salaria TaxID=2903142 RepID=UPI0024B4DDC9|nr:NADPH:quinone oxidoreductase family protein [Rhabdothermincola salaria]
MGNETMRAWQVHTYGDPLDVLRLDEVAVPTPDPGELLVRVEGIPLNLNDLERINGGNMMVRPELPYSPGMEVTGVVEAAGEGAESFVGRRVAATTKMAIGGYAELALCPAVAAFDMPADVPMPDAAALFFPFHLAWIGLFDRAELTAGETVLIHAAAGGSGSAAVQLAKDAGARVIATAGSEAKLALCRELGADVTIDYTTTDIAEVVLAETEGRGVDVVFDNVGQAVWDASFKSLAYNGRYVMMGFASNKEVADEPFVVPRTVALSNAKLCGVMLNYQSDEMVGFLKGAMGWNVAPSSLGVRIQDEVLERYRAGRVKAVVGEVVPFEELPRAIDAMANRATIGRVVITTS